MKRITKIIVWLLIIAFNLSYSVAFAKTVTKPADQVGFINAVPEKMAKETQKLKGSSKVAEFLVQLNTDLQLEALSAPTKSSGSSLDKAARKTQVVKALKADAEARQKPIIEKLKQKKMKYTSFFVVNMLQVSATYEQVEELAKDPAIKRVYLNEQVQVITPELEKPAEVIMAEPTLWNIQNVQADQAWSMGYKGQGVVVGIIDSGADWSHPAIQRQFRAYDPLNPGSPDSTKLNSSWFDSINGVSTPFDDNGHGTHCIGTMVGRIPGSAVIGVAPEATWIAAKALSAEGSAYNADLLQSGQWMMAPGGDPTKAPDVINNSWGGNDVTSEWFRDMVRAWRSAGIIPVFAAGNQISGEPAPWAGSIVGPAYYPESFAVAAVDSANGLASFSKLGPSTMDPTIAKPEISAPGVSIYSSLPGGTYGYYSGTSMAAPHVAGVAALILSANPTLSVDDVLLTIQRSASALTNAKFTSSPNMGFGYGLINAKNAIDQSINGLARANYTIFVMDELFQPVPGARITLLEKPAAEAGLSNETGLYKYYNLPVGGYTVNVYHPRFGNARQQISVVEGLEPTVFVPLRYAGTASSSLKYDDGSAEDAVVYNAAGVGYGVAMRPERYGLVKSISAYFWGTTFPNPGGTSLRLSIYEADKNMIPTSKLLIPPFNVTVTRGALNTFDVSAYGLKTDQPFVPVFTQVTTGTYSPAIGIDTSSPSGNKHGYVLSGSTFIPRVNLGQGGALMIRATMEYAMDKTAVSLKGVTPAQLYNGKLYTSSSAVELSGTATNTKNVAITNQGNYAATLAVAQDQFKGIVGLTEGLNRLKADIWLNEIRVASSNELKVILDLTAPVIQASVPEEVLHTRSYLLTGTVNETNLRKLTINGTEIPVDLDGSFSRVLDLATGLNQFSVVAEDIVGFTTEKILQLTTNQALEAIEITKLPDKVVYFPGEELDLTGLQVTGTFSDGTRAVIPALHCQISGFDSTIPAAGQLLTVTVEDKTATFAVDILAKALTAIDIIQLPNKLQYIQGQSLDLTGLKVQGSYNDGTTEMLAISADQVTGFDSTGPAAGLPLTVTVEGLTAVFNVDILAKALKLLDIIQLPNKLQYIQGQPLDLTGLKVRGSYNDGTTELLTITPDQVTGFDSSEPAAGQTLTISVDGKTASFAVYIIRREATTVEVLSYPAKTEYFIGESLDLSGLSLKATFNDGQVEAVPNSQIISAGFDSSVANDSQTITLTYDTHSFTYQIAIRHKPTVKTFAGANRYLTANLISQTMYQKASVAILVSGTNFPDALAAGPLAHALQAPILLTDPKVLSPETASELTRLGVTKVIILGGTLAISDAVETSLKSKLGVTVQRISGSTRYQTALRTAEYLKTLKGVPRKVMLASGTSFADALSGGGYAAGSGYPILITDGKTVNLEMVNYLNANGIKEILVVGGNLVVSAELETQLKAKGFNVTRISGATRTQTSAALANQYYPEAEFAIAANGWTFADALAAAPLAAKLNAPILLVAKDSVDAAISTYLGKSRIHTIHVVGGDLVVTPAVRNALLEAIQ